MPIAGARKLRQWGFSAAQSAHGTAATPTEAVPWGGILEINPNWTTIDNVDTGSIDEYMLPYRTVTDSSVTLEGPLAYNSIPLLMAAGVRGGVTATGGPAYTWAHQALSLTGTTLDEFSAQWGDDYPNDGVRLRDGVVEQIEFTMGDDLGPWQVSSQWYFGQVSPNVTRVSGLVVGSNLAWVYGADTALFLNSTAGTIGTTQISDALHSAKVTITNTIDRKRFANGSNTRFAVSAFYLGERTIEAEFTFAKADAIVGLTNSELRNFLNATPVTRYVELVATSTEIITGSTPYSWSLRLPLTWRTKGEGEMNANTTVTLTGTGRYDSGLGYALRSSVVNSNATLP
jgi:hypothetical protein